MNVAHWTDADELKSTSIHMLATSPSMLRQFVMHTCHGPRSLKQTNPSPYRNDTKLSKLKCGIRQIISRTTPLEAMPQDRQLLQGAAEKNSPPSTSWTHMPMTHVIEIPSTTTLRVHMPMNLLPVNHGSSSTDNHSSTIFHPISGPSKTKRLWHHYPHTAMCSRQIESDI